ncbi:hypothetical protein OSTOST_16036, partial [Ostertagia ostertagi]
MVENYKRSRVSPISSAPKSPGPVVPPVPRNHEAYDRCRMFLEYLYTTWYAGQFKDLWFKLLGGVVGVRYPRMDKLLLDLQGCTSIANARLLNVEERRSDGKRLHKKDILAQAPCGKGDEPIQALH